MYFPGYGAGYGNGYAPQQAGGFSNNFVGYGQQSQLYAQQQAPAVAMMAPAAVSMPQRTAATYQPAMNRLEKCKK